MYEIYQRLLDEKKLKNSDVARATGLSNTILSDWKRGNTTPKTDNMKKIAEFLEVTIDFLTGKSDTIECPICNFRYNPLSEQSKRDHQKYHDRFLMAKEKYPFLMNYTDAEKAKYDCLGEVYDSVNTSEQVNAYENYVKAQFSLKARSVDYKIEHLDYEQFFQTQIGMNETDETISHELADAIVEKHGLNRDFINNDDLLLARASNNRKLMELLRYAENLSPEMLDSLIIQTKALAESKKQG